MAKLTKDFEDESASFSNLFQDGNDSDENESDAHFETIGGNKYELYCAPDDGTSLGALFAFKVWSGSVQIAEYIQTNPSVVGDKTVVEFGAAAALPSLVALSCRASKVLITDYPSEHILSAIKLNVDVNKKVLGDDVEKRCIVQGHLWGDVKTSEAEGTIGTMTVLNKQNYDVAIVAECLWNHSLHAVLLDSIDFFLKPGGIVLLSYAHHVRGLESKDDAFFELASNSKQFSYERIETKEMRYMWDENKTVTQYLYILRKPTTTFSSIDENGSFRVPFPVPTLAQEPEDRSQSPPPILSSPLTTLQKLQNLSLQDNHNEAEPYDSESLAKYMRSQAAEIAKEELLASKEPLHLPLDRNGHVLPITLPGPLAPKHEDHPAYGMRIWPPRRTTQENSDGTNGRGGTPLPSWVTGEEDMNPFPDWTKE